MVFVGDYLYLVTVQVQRSAKAKQAQVVGVNALLERKKIELSSSIMKSNGKKNNQMNDELPAMGKH